VNEDTESVAADMAVPPVLRNLEDLVFVAFNGRAFAVDRYDGSKVWKVKFPKGSGFASLMLDGDRLIASIQGYTYCIDPWRGVILWTQEFSGEGMGIPSLTSIRAGFSASAGAAARHAEEAAAQKRSQSH